MQSYHGISISQKEHERHINNWTLLGQPFRIGRDTRAVYQCACGRVSVQYVRNIETGKSTRCSHCPKVRLRHGKSHTRVHNIWCGILTRCDNPHFRAYNRYGGRGITICERWRTFENFYADMGDPPPGYSIERIDNDGNYCPENCKWIPRNKQVENRCVTKRCEYKGRQMTCREIAIETGTNHKILYQRIFRDGMTPEEAVIEPAFRRHKRILYRGEVYTYAGLSRLSGIRRATIENRLKSGWSVEEAVNTPCRKMAEYKLWNRK